MLRRKMQKAATQPSVRTFATWSLALIKTAEVRADGGDLSLAADLCEEILADDRVNGVLTARTRGLLGLKVEFEKAGDRRRSGRPVKALDIGEDWWWAYPEAELASLLDWGVMLNVGLAQNEWTERDNGRVIPRLSRYHARWLRYDWQKRSWYVQTEGSIDTPVVPGDGQWVLHTPNGSSRPWAEGAWRSLARLILAKQYARQDWALQSEVLGQPIKVGVGVQGSTDAQRDELTTELAELGRDTALTLPPGWDLKLLEGKARNWDTFKAQIEMVNNAIAIRLAGQNLTTDVTGGSLAAAKVHQIVRGDLIRFDGESLSTTLHEQSLTWWADLNFGSKTLAPWPSWQTEEPEDRLATAQTRAEQAKAIVALRAAGVKLDDIYEEFGLEAAPEPVAPVAPPVPPVQTNEQQTPQPQD